MKEGEGSHHGKEKDGEKADDTQRHVARQEKVIPRGTCRS